jgi:hypothetical protein
MNCTVPDSLQAAWRIPIGLVRSIWRDCGVVRGIGRELMQEQGWVDSQEIGRPQRALGAVCSA